MREIGTMWQIGVLTGKPCIFLVQSGPFSAFCRVSIGSYSINRASEWLWQEAQDTPQNGQDVHGFQVRTPVCHIVPVSRAYGGGLCMCCVFSTSVGRVRVGRLVASWSATFLMFSWSSNVYGRVAIIWEVWVDLRFRFLRKRWRILTVSGIAWFWVVPWLSFCDCISGSKHETL